MTASLVTVSVVICAYTQRRWRDLLAAVESVTAQSVTLAEMLVVIDHNAELAARARADITDAVVLVNEHGRGLSGARNTALRYATGDVVVFLDDDAAAAGPDWLALLLAHYRDPAVRAVGGAATPLWPSVRPITLPAATSRGELDWVVGCTYRGQPERVSDVRNLMGCNMSFRRSVFASIGGFTEDMGRVGTVPVGCEETELCIRLLQSDPAARIVFEPRAIVRHRVSVDRLSWSYLRRRSWGEGISKAAVSRLVGARDALSTERSYAATVIPAAVLRELARLRLRSALALMFSVMFAAAGYARGKIASERGPVAPEPIAVGEWDRAVGGPPRLLTEAPTARILVRDGLTVVGEVWSDGGELDSLEDRPATETARTGTPTVSVVIPSAGRHESAARCVRSVLATGYPRLEIVVVDNRPGSADSSPLRELADADPRVRYVPEPVVGLSNARNRGAAEAGGEIIAFTDDDAVVDRLWLDRMVVEFADAAVDCVTGLVLPLALDTPAQRWFEEWGGFGKGFHRRRFDASGDSDPGAGRLYPFAAGLFGSGNNMAWRAGIYRDLGGCDPLLGAGSTTQSGEDLELFIRLVRHGGVLVYTPHAVVRHEHRRELGELVHQIQGYGTGLLPLFAVYVGRRPHELLAVARRIPGGLYHLLAGGSTRNSGRGSDFPGELSRAELRGVMTGPVALLWGLLHGPHRRLGLPEPIATAAQRAAAGPPLRPIDALRSLRSGR